MENLNLQLSLNEVEESTVWRHFRFHFHFASGWIRKSKLWISKENANNSTTVRETDETLFIGHKQDVAVHPSTGDVSIRRSATWRTELSPVEFVIVKNRDKFAYGTSSTKKCEQNTVRSRYPAIRCWSQILASPLPNTANCFRLEGRMWKIGNLHRQTRMADKTFKKPKLGFYFMIIFWPQDEFWCRKQFLCHIFYIQSC